MKYVTQAIAAIWQFTTFIIKVALLSAIALTVLAIIMPENAMKVIEIMKGLGLC